MIDGDFETGNVYVDDYPIFHLGTNLSIYGIRVYSGNAGRDVYEYRVGDSADGPWTRIHHIWHNMAVGGGNLWYELLLDGTYSGSWLQSVPPAYLRFLTGNLYSFP